MCKEVEDLDNDKVFEVIPISSKTKNKRSSSFICSFKHKWSPMGELIKLKAFFYAHNETQEKGIDCNKKFLPVVN